MATLPEKTRLYRELQRAVEMGMSIPEFTDSENKYVDWKEDELRTIHEKHLNPDHVEPPSSEDEEDIEVPTTIEQVETITIGAPENVNPALSHAAYEAAQEAVVASGEQPQTYTDWVSEAVSDPAVQAAMAAYSRAVQATSAAPDPGARPGPEGITGPFPGDSAPPPVYAIPREQWAQYPPRELARLLNVPYSDKVADRAGLTFNTHGLNDILRIDSRGRVWYRDEVMKPAIPKKRMVRKVKTVTANVETINTYRPDGGIDETFEIAGDEQSEIEIKISMPTSQVGIYIDPRMPFKIHQYGTRRAFDYEEVMNYFGGRDLVPSTVQTVYVDIDLCYTIESVRETIDRMYRETVLGRSTYNVG